MLSSSDCALFVASSFRCSLSRSSDDRKLTCSCFERSSSSAFSLAARSLSSRLSSSFNAFSSALLSESPQLTEPSSSLSCRQSRSAASIAIVSALRLVSASASSALSRLSSFSAEMRSLFAAVCRMRRAEISSFAA